MEAGYEGITPGKGKITSAMQPKISKAFKNVLEYFGNNGVKLVVRLNKKLYDEKRFMERGMEHRESEQRLVLSGICQLAENFTESVLRRRNKPDSGDVPGLYRSFRAYYTEWRRGSCALQSWIGSYRNPHRSISHI